MADKPIIANPQFEYDSRTLELADQAQVTTWVDSRPGGGTDATTGQGYVKYGATGGADQWSFDVPGVIFDQTPQADTLSFAPSMILGDITFFAVLKLTDLTNGAAIIGTSDTITPPTGLYLLVYPDGSVHFIIGHNGVVAARDLGTATGLVSTGDRILISARLDVPAGGMIIRVNGTERARYDGVELGNVWWFGPKIRQCNLPSTGGFPGHILGEDQNMPWISGYTSAASNAEIGEMERYLGEVFRVYVAAPERAIANVEFNTSIRTEMELPQSIDARLELEGTITEDVDA